ncbi:MAG: SRPBCC domain-containing protein [Acidimicrobiales bacterium]
MSTHNPPSPPPVVRSATVSVAPADAFRIFTDEIGAWWPSPTHGIFGAKSGGVVFRDGRLIEISQDGSEVVWGEVARWDPPHLLTIAWHPGRGADEASTVEVSFVADGDATRVIIEHSGWDSFGVDAAHLRRGYVGPNAWGYVLDHFADGATAHVEAADLAGLAAAYEAFFTEFLAGGFGPPPEGEWNAEQVVAHVALNDGAMLGVCQALVHGGELRFDNLACHEPAALGRWIESCGTPDVMLGRVRQSSRQLLAAIARLSADQRATSVHCHLVHAGSVVLDEPRPWGVVAVDVQAGHHLPAHVEQLRNLRT